MRQHGWRRTDRGERLRDELSAIASLIAAHGEEFCGIMYQTGQASRGGAK